MNVGELTNDQLKKAIEGRLRAGELDLLLREAARRGLHIEIGFEHSGAAEVETEDLPRLQVSFRDLLASTPR